MEGHNCLVTLFNYLTGTRDPNGGATYHYGGSRYRARFPWQETKLGEDLKVMKDIESGKQFMLVKAGPLVTQDSLSCTDWTSCMDLLYSRIWLLIQCIISQPMSLQPDWNTSSKQRRLMQLLNSDSTYFLGLLVHKYWKFCPQRCTMKYIQYLNCSFYHE